MDFETYCSGAVEIAKRHDVDQWLGVQTEDGHCRFDGYPFEACFKISLCIDELASYREDNWAD